MNLKKIINHVGYQIRQRRRYLNLTQEDLSEAANISVTYLSEIERGLRSPSLKVMIRLADKLNLRPQNFFSEDNRPFVVAEKQEHYPSRKDELIQEATALLHQLPVSDVIKIIEMIKVISQVKK